MSPSIVVTDCPECLDVGSVIFGTCEVCFAEFDEDPYETITHGGDDVPALIPGRPSPA